MEHCTPYTDVHKDCASIREEDQETKERVSFNIIENYMALGFQPMTSYN